jgi:hypothetical protein
MSGGGETFDEAHLQSLVSSLKKRKDANDDAKGLYVRDQQCHGWGFEKSTTVA